ncbi:virulence plasmid 65kDa B protein-domain-containing protein [Leptodontidium sp. 2 PMI_412]|nr:virulence plasmid 65kDa B protein-domain-containing protein [Leptodontidium sp. 2 PMI_412]
MENSHTHQSPAPGATSASDDPAAGGTPNAVHSNQSSKFKGSIPSPPSLSLPKGGGAISGIGEKFDVNACAGTASASVPIRVTAGRDAFQPTLSLSYDSGSGNGAFGMGWQISNSQISRKTSKGLPKYCDYGPDSSSDVFLMSDAEDLVPIMRRDANGKVIMTDNGPQIFETTRNGYVVRRFAPRIEQHFALIERWSSVSHSGDVYWKVVSPENVVSIYGNSDNSRIFSPDALTGSAKRIFSWLIAEAYDSKGNAMLYTYKAEDSTGIPDGQAHEANRSDLSRSAGRYLKRIFYGNQAPNREANWNPFSPAQLPLETWRFSVVFDYGEHNLEHPDPSDPGLWPVRSDPFSDSRAGFEVRHYRLCQRILMFHHFKELKVPNYLVTSTELMYEPNKTGAYLTSVILAGYVLDSSNKSYIKQALPPTEFEYTLFPNDNLLSSLTVEDINHESLENIPAGVDADSIRWVDIDAEGLTGMLFEQGGNWFYKRNTSANNIGADNTPKPRFEALETLSQKPNTSTTTSQFGDVTGSGTLDVIEYGPDIWGYYERRKNGWTSFKEFRSFPNIDFKNPSVKVLDLTGDGLPDILICADSVYTWYPSAGEKGFDEGQSVIQPNDEKRGPVAIYSDTEQTIFTADMSGDGLSDLLRIRNGDISYWPALGYGKFGDIIIMDNAPCFTNLDLFNPKRVQLADIDGSGTTDILYFSEAGVDIYLNHSGNGFANRKRIDTVPPPDSLSFITTCDLLGTGTPCIVWSSQDPSISSTSIRYLNITQDQKPHLLKKITNNLGSVTHVTYAPSTRFYLNDKQMGRPWLTQLPFPVHCVEKVETEDLISRSKYVVQYRYSHGFFDPREREFRGFGYVETVDTEFFTATTDTTPSNIDQSWHIPPLLTRTWFNVGVYIDSDNISQHMREEYFGSSSSATSHGVLLDDTVLPANLDAEQQREACRALKGHTLRTEIFSLDGSPSASVPYSIDESNLAIVAIQPEQDSHSHGRYFVSPRENLSVHCERKTDDPRLTHGINLELNAFGQVTKYISLSYGRQSGKSTLTGADKERQEALSCTYTETALTNSIDTNDAYRVPKSCEVRLYELCGLQLNADSKLFKAEDLVRNDFQLIKSLPEVPFEASTNPKTRSKRLLNRSVLLFRSNDLSRTLPSGQLQSMALSATSYDLLYTPGLVQAHMGRIDNTAGVFKDAGYVDINGDGNWWKPSGKISYSADPLATISEELIQARTHFFLPRCFFDPFGNAATAEFDEYCLFPVLTKDSIGNEETVQIDYRVQQSQLVTDPNGNRSSVAFDPLGMMVGTADMGKASEHVGDNLENFKTHLTDDDLKKFFAAPTGKVAQELLGNASSRTVYNISRFWKESLPAYTAVVSSETHTADATPQQGRNIKVKITYSDGFSRAVQVKTQSSRGPLTENGPAVDRWLGTGWTIFNNKGKPVQQYEPFFDDTFDFKFDFKVGKASTMFYDPLVRSIATLRSDNAVTKVVFDAWSQLSYDFNDMVLVSKPDEDPDVGGFFKLLPREKYSPSWYDARIKGQKGVDEQNAATRAAAHANTPKVMHYDPLARPIFTVDDNGPQGLITARAIFDISNNQRKVIDSLGRTIIQYDYNMGGELIHQASMEAGERWTFTDSLNQHVLTWNSRGFVNRSVYDKLHRVVEAWCRDGTGPEKMVEKIMYGETVSDATSRNLRGRIFQTHDQSGLSTNSHFDFKYNVLSNERQLAQNYKDILDWSGNVDLEPDIYTVTATYDALNRQVQTTAADGTITFRLYDDSGRLSKTYVNIRGELTSSDYLTWAPFLVQVEYNPMFQVTKVQYGNGVTKNCTYDPFLYRLQAMKSTSSTGVLQNLSYTYDPMGNITHIRDAAQQVLYFRNNRVDPSSDFVYDAVYRLISATGREHVGQTNGKPSSPTAANPMDSTHVNLDSPGDGGAMAKYSQSYVYDDVGNILIVKHETTDPKYPGWTRNYTYNEPSLLEPGMKSNRLSSTSVSNVTETYKYEGNAGLHGSITSMPHLPVMEWDFKDQLSSTSTQIVRNGGTASKTFYVYDSGGHRVRKISESQADANSTPVRSYQVIYLAGVEIYQKFTPAGDNVLLERVSFHTTDESKRIATIESRTKGTDAGIARQVRYQLDNHLGSSVVEVDDQSRVISYEEYFPFGSTSYQAVNNQTDVPKRYRFNGKERDRENGLDFYGARYYASWLGRWTSSDPSGLRDGPNTFAFVGNDPINHVDPDGTWKLDWKTAAKEIAVGVAITAVVVGVVVLTGGVAAAAAPAIIAAAVEGSALASAAVGAATVASIAAPVVEAGVTAYGVYQTTKTVTGLALDFNPDTGKPYTDDEGSKAVGGLALSLGMAGAGAVSRRLAGGARKAWAATKAGAQKLKSVANKVKDAILPEVEAGLELATNIGGKGGKVGGMAAEGESWAMSKMVNGAESGGGAASKVGPADASKFDVDVYRSGAGRRKLNAEVASRATDEGLKAKDMAKLKEEWHHIFPRGGGKLKKIFEEVELSADGTKLQIDDWQIPLNRLEHDAVHSPRSFGKSWNEEWKEWIAAAEDAGKKITSDDLFAQASKMLEDRGLGFALKRLGRRKSS